MLSVPWIPIQWSPVPVSDTLWAPPPVTASSAKLRPADSAVALLAGVNVTVTMQVLFGVSGDPMEQVELVITKSPAFVPVTFGLLEKLRFTFPVFLNVTLICKLAGVTGTEPKGRLAGTEAAEPVPVPISRTDWLLGEALSAKFSEAFSAPTIDAVSLTITVQLPPPEATGLAVVHVLELIVKSAAFVPVMPGLLVKLRAAVPVFVRVADIVELIPTAIMLYWMLAGSMTTGIPDGVPVPDRVTLCVLGVALSEKLREAFSVVVVEGLKVTMTVQLPPATTGLAVVQLLKVMLKSAELVPVIPGALVKFSEPFPMFIRVTVMGELVTP